MRLVCPSCSAEYEVDEAAIGARGRMVRCARCSSEWFQAPAVGATAPLPPEPEPEPVAPAAPAPEPAAAPDPAPITAKRETAREAATDDPLARLRAEFRDDPIEKPKTFKVEPQAPFQEEKRTEQIYFDEDPPVVEAAATAAVVEETRVRSRRRTEPEDLAASLRESDDGRSGGGSGAFLAGFATVTLLSLIMIAVYVKAPDIAALAPAAESPLKAYAAAVDQGRVALASLIGG